MQIVALINAVKTFKNMKTSHKVTLVALSVLSVGAVAVYAYSKRAASEQDEI